MASRNIAAIIGAEGFNPCHFTAQIGNGGRLHRILRPGGKIGGKGTGHRAQIGGVCAEIHQFYSIHPSAFPAVVKVGQRLERHQILLHFCIALVGCWLGRVLCSDARFRRRTFRDDVAG